MPAPTAPWTRWARELARVATEAEGELEYWQTLPWSRVRSLPVDGEGENVVSAAASIERELSQEETSELLTGLAVAYRARVDEALLAALARAYPRWLSEREMGLGDSEQGENDDPEPGVLLVEIEGHGREPERAGDLDLTRTVGWFTSIYPVAVELARNDDVRTTLLRAKEAVRGAPGGGVGWGLLKHICGGKATEVVRAWPRAEVAMNYLGRFDNVLTEAGLFAGAAESGGPTQAGGQRRGHLLAVNSLMAAGRLRVSWTFGEHVHERRNIERLADLQLQELRAIVEHCRSPEAGGFAPSDFPLARLNEEKLNKLSSLLDSVAED